MQPDPEWPSPEPDIDPLTRPPGRWGRNPMATAAAMAERGDVAGVLAVLTGHPCFTIVCVPEGYGALLRAAEVAARTDPAGFAEVLFGRMVAFTAFVLLRNQALAARRLGADEPHGRPGLLWWEATDQLLE